MNLQESDLYKEKLEKNTRNRRGVMLSIVLCAFLIAFLFIMIIVLKYQDSITEKLFINDTQVSIPEGFYKNLENGIYLDIKQISSLLGYTYTKGEYNKFNEDEDSCYLQNNFEVVSMAVNSSKFKKFIEVTGTPTIADIQVSMKNENGYNETFSLKKELKFIDGKIYASLEDVTEMLNVQIDWKEYRFKFYSLEYMITYAKNVVGKAGYKEMSGYYENLKTVLYGYTIVGNGSENKESLYGVISLSDGKEIISIKYDDIKFVQNVKEFYVTVANGTMGILSDDGSTVIAPSEYEDISLLDDEKQLYLVEKDSEYGVVNRTGKRIIHAENDEIGLDISKFDLVEIDNNSLLYNKCIPVKKDNKYGLYNIDGDLVAGIVYNDLGYHSTATSTTSGNEESVLLIPPSVGIKGIVLNLNDLYGIYDVTTERILIPCSCSKIYAITKSGETTYYIEIGGEQYKLEDYLKENNLANIDENGEPLINKTERNTENSNTVTDASENTVTNTTNSTIKVPVE